MPSASAAATTRISSCGVRIARHSILMVTSGATSASPLLNIGPQPVQPRAVRQVKPHQVKPRLRRARDVSLKPSHVKSSNALAARRIGKRGMSSSRGKGSKRLLSPSEIRNPVLCLLASVHGLCNRMYSRERSTCPSSRVQLLYVTLYCTRQFA